jgi:hypothetical protein
MMVRRQWQEGGRQHTEALHVEEEDFTWRRKTSWERGRAIALQI